MKGGVAEKPPPALRRQGFRRQVPTHLGCFSQLPEGSLDLGVGRAPRDGEDCLYQLPHQGTERCWPHDAGPLQLWGLAWGFFHLLANHFCLFRRCREKRWEKGGRRRRNQKRRPLWPSESRKGGSRGSPNAGLRRAAAHLPLLFLLLASQRSTLWWNRWLSYSQSSHTDWWHHKRPQRHPEYCSLGRPVGKETEVGVISSLQESRHWAVTMWGRCPTLLAEQRAGGVRAEVGRWRWSRKKSHSPLVVFWRQR